MIKFMAAVLAAGLAVGLAVGQLAVVRSAGAAPPVDDWRTYPCPSGTLDVTTLTSEPLGEFDVLVSIDGQLGCALRANDLRQFGIGVFTVGAASAIVYPSMLRRYATTAPTVFRAWVPVVGGTQRGVCLFAVRSPALSCVTVSATTDGTATAEPLDRTRWPTSAREADPVDAHPQPQCNTCWSTTPG